MSRLVLTLYCLLLLSLASFVGEAKEPNAAHPEADKNGFDFFNPTPIELLRPMTIDGPGATDSPYTVDAGHFQVEMILAGYSAYKNRFEGVPYRYDWWSVGPINLKVGLFNRLDMQLVLEPYNHSFEREH